MSTVFSKIISGELPSYKIAETDKFLAFLDINPNAKGHTLCIPKEEVDKLFELDDETYAGLMKFSKKIAMALEEAVPCKRVGMAVIGLEVSHVHVHLIPLNKMKDMDFGNKLNFSHDQLSRLAEEIKENL
ncbi:histidine triad (HIT) family protein [Gillisia mitskevichiae]|uniref:Histidine triad (HIT) family protein n=1 Tax=Gillisia mitskevichiae TaxID=270921 RepID=A0A495PXP2_9FLAO|nr:HIT family protein [Gillisia mitskevichiae]RKS55171.1 histidine triad (HIT) family protein [Gillisia mitskevichiae]